VHFGILPLAHTWLAFLGFTFTPYLLTLLNSTAAPEFEIAIGIASVLMLRPDLQLREDLFDRFQHFAP
jgi:hypothetical protein